MPVLHTFTDPDEYADAIRAARAEVTVSGPGKSTAGSATLYRLRQ